MTKTATPISEPEIITPPAGGGTEFIIWKTSDGDFIRTSSALTPWVRETLAFECDKYGEIQDFTDIGSADYGQHEEAIRDAGYEPVGKE